MPPPTFEEPHSIVLIVADDMGACDLGYYGNLNAETPVLDQLAESSLRHDRFYVTPICAPKHNGRFKLSVGSPARAPSCRGLATYPIDEREGRLWLNVVKAGSGGACHQKTYMLKIVSNSSVATFIKELVLEPVDGGKVQFTPVNYIQLDIPQYERICFREFDIPEPYDSVWERQLVFDLVATNSESGRRNNYSIASNLAGESTLPFNVRIVTPPPVQDCPPGIGYRYVFKL